MKKHLTKIIAMFLVLVCFVAVGCAGSISGAVAIEACQKYIDDLETLDSIVYGSSYVYPTLEAQAEAREVEVTDLSKYGIEYSHYNEFNYDDGTANGHSMFSPKILYHGAVGVLTNLSKYIDNLDKETFSLKTTYKFITGSGEEYFKVKYSKNTLYVYIEKVNYYTQYTIKLNDSNDDWISVEKRAHGFESYGNIEYYHYYSVEKSTSFNRVFDRCTSMVWRIESTASDQDQMSVIDFEETTQKMLFVDEAFYPNEVNGITKTLYDYINVLNFEEFVNVMDKDSAVAITITSSAA